VKNLHTEATMRAPALRPSNYRQSGYLEKLLAPTDTNLLYAPYTPWQFATGVDTVRVVWKNLQGGSNLVSQPFIEVAKVRPDAPVATPTLLGSALTGNGESNVNASVSSVTGSAMWFRLGIAYKSSTTTAQAHVGLFASWIQNGQLGGTEVVQLQANDTSTNHAMIVTPWIPQIFVAKLKLATVANGFVGSNSLQYELVQQTAATSVENPTSNWAAPTGSSFVTVSGYAENCTAEMTPALGNSSDRWIRFGVLFGLFSGTGWSTATLNTMVTVRS
jgi:hypothetical protein